MVVGILPFFDFTGDYYTRDRYRDAGSPQNVVVVDSF